MQTNNRAAEQNFIALDLEYNQPSRSIIQVGVAIGNALQPDAHYTVKRWTILVDESISPEIVTLTGITDQAIAEQGVSYATCAAELGELIITHNAFVNPVTWGGGDSHDLLACFEEHGLAFPHFGRRWIDVKTWAGLLALAHAAGPKQVSGGLRSIMGRYKLQFKGQAHRADVDAFNTLRLFFRLIERQRTLESAADMMQSI